MKLVLAALLALPVYGMTQTPNSSVDKLVETCKSKMHEAVHETLLAQQAIFRQFPEVKACEVAKWPDTPQCNLVARSITKSVLIDLKEYK